MPTTTREVHLVARPAGVPASSDFRTVTTTLDTPKAGQLLVRNDWLSVDPYMRRRMNDAPSYLPPYQLGTPMEGGAVGTVIESGTPEVPVGTVVLHALGWREHALLTADQAQPLDLSLAPPQAFLGPLGVPGHTAYTGLTRIAPVQPGETVFVSAAAGAVGTVAARVARHRGATSVIGSAGGVEKARRLTDEFGYDIAIDYKLGDLPQQLRRAAPDGIDVYFDNVGGDHLTAAIDALRLDGRIAMCGAISQANATEPTPGPRNLPLVIGKRLTLRGFIVADHNDLIPEYLPLAATWLKDASLANPETIVDGIGSMVAAFIGLLDGINTGKMLIRLC